MKNIKFECVIVSKKIKGDYIDLVLQNKNLAEACFPGGFIHADCGDGILLRRPISVCDCEGETIRIVFRLKGEGTKALAAKNEGESINCLGCLGKGFSFDENAENVILAGGGIGVFPLLYVARKLNKKPKVIMGYATESAVYLKEDFEALGCEVCVVTNDGSLGQKAFVPTVLENELEKSKCELIMSCGPMIMMEKIAKIAIEKNIECQLSLEERMGCGIGVCLCCVTKINKKDEQKHLCVCKDGPVFNAREVVFND